MEEHKMLAQAIGFAAMKHAGQVRRDGTPYIYHPLSVAELLKNYGFGIKYQIVAILHDVLEDTDATEDEIRIYGEDVLESVKLLTRPKGMDEEVYVSNILKNQMASVVKNADKIHNMWGIAWCDDKKWGNKYIGKAKKYYGNKFSYALDLNIDIAQKLLVGEKLIQRGQDFTIEDMRLYSETDCNE